MLLFGLLVTWVTPLWLISVGVALGVAVLAVAYLVLLVVAPRAASASVTGVREGILLPIGYLCLALSAFAVAGVLLVPALPYSALLAAVSRLSIVGPVEVEVEVPASSHDVKLNDLAPQLGIRLLELNAFTVESDQPVTIVTNIMSNLSQALAIRVSPGNSAVWQRPAIGEKDRRAAPDESTATEWIATNVGSTPAKVRIGADADIEYPEVRVVPWVAASLVTLVFLYLLARLALPKISAIALVTAKEAMAQPLFYVVLALGTFSLLAFIFVPYNTFGDDVKMLKDSGLTLIMVLAMIVAVWSASVSVSEEVEGRTALTVLSKPVARRQFVLGKFLGVLGPVLVLFIVLGTLFLITVSFKVVYDARETAKTEPAWQLCYLEMIRIVPGLVLAFLETIVLAAISVAVSTRLPMLANLIVCASIYVLGHLVPMLVNSSVGKFEIVRFAGQFIATVLPVLDNFNIQAAVAAGAVVPLSYLGMAALYCALYTTIAILLGLAMFEDRDLA